MGEQGCVSSKAYAGGRGLNAASPRGPAGGLKICSHGRQQVWIWHDFEMQVGRAVCVVRHLWMGGELTLSLVVPVGLEAASRWAPAQILTGGRREPDNHTQDFEWTLSLATLAGPDTGTPAGASGDLML